VRQPVDRLAEHVTHAIVDMVANRPVGLEELLVEPDLRWRGSTGPVRE
jgi:hypothetical protein